MIDGRTATTAVALRASSSQRTETFHAAKPRVLHRLRQPKLKRRPGATRFLERGQATSRRATGFVRSRKHDESRVRRDGAEKGPERGLFRASHRHPHVPSPRAARLSGYIGAALLAVGALWVPPPGCARRRGVANRGRRPRNRARAPYVGGAAATRAAVRPRLGSLPRYGAWGPGTVAHAWRPHAPLSERPWRLPPGRPCEWAEARALWTMQELSHRHQIFVPWRQRRSARPPGRLRGTQRSIPLRCGRRCPPSGDVLG